MVEVKDWFKGSEKVVIGNQQSSFLYKSIKIEKMIPNGKLESMNALHGALLSASGYPLYPKKETFSLQTPDGRIKVRYFLNFDPVAKRTETSVRFYFEGEPIILRISGKEYFRAKRIFTQAFDEMEEDSDYYEFDDYDEADY